MLNAAVNASASASSTRVALTPVKQRVCPNRQTRSKHGAQSSCSSSLSHNTRAFEFISANCKRRSLVILLTDLVDESGSRELLTSLRLIRPRHLPLVVTMADRDLQAVVQTAPRDTRELFTQSVAEEIIYQRAAALRLVETQGGLALDVTAATLTPLLLETYLRVKERGLL